ncbi:hypothetical protein BDV96DRAFT_604367 [Lophiotrema nucula]|uniref:F-box domain-containing protein n=1 Tax=Lophiotrema nucula TaxID=690887 RepID=A0A6A5YRQ6_9PLEO|nr:hypothetical protein BDV96DRAFT_604367 [Lophiotrema nucula]
MASNLGPLLALPTEILQQIVTPLPIESVIALAITCKKALDMFGTSLEGFQRMPNRIERSRFIIALERDCPGYYSDTVLRRKIPNFFPNNAALFRSSPPACPRNVFHILEEFDYEISWQHLALALKRHHLGASHGISLDTFKVHKKQAIHDVRCVFLTSQLRLDGDPPVGAGPGPETIERNVDITVTPKIVENYLLLKSVYKIPYDESEARDLDLTACRTLDLRLCRHVGTKARGEPWFDNSLSILLWSPPPHEMRDFRTWWYPCGDPWCDCQEDRNQDDLDYNECLGSQPPFLDSGLQQCAFCFTEYQLKVEQAPSEAHIVITVYHNLGHGKSKGSPAWDPENRVWKAFAGTKKDHECHDRYTDFIW